MSTRERKREHTDPLPDDHSQEESWPREQIESLRDNASELAVAADKIIRDALSPRSDDYLRAMRQRGGA